jgi:hypothetical protein
MNEFHARKNGLGTSWVCMAAVASFVAVAGAEEESMTGKAATDSIVWVVDNTQAIRGITVEAQGEPKVIDTEKGKAVLFNGENEALFLAANPLKDATTFTLEALFRPDPDGLPEQRFVHIQETGADSRILLETRLTGDSWFGDTYIKTPAGDCALADGRLLHPLGRWHTLAVAFDGTNMIQYVDGKQELSRKIRVQPLREGRVSIGCRINTVHWFKGAVRQVRFTRSALPPEQLLRP